MEVIEVDTEIRVDIETTKSKMEIKFKINIMTTTGIGLGVFLCVCLDRLRQIWNGRINSSASSNGNALAYLTTSASASVDNI